jgi:7-cyano-7-deazaguanine synthase in queuosine biosynthesis
MRVFVRRDPNETSAADVIFEVGANIYTGEDDFASQFGSATSLEADLLLVGASIFAADRCLERGPLQHAERSIELSIPVVNAATLLPLAGNIERVLRKLSHDSWRVEFRHIGGQPEQGFSTPNKPGRTLLFSGGLDSFAAGYEFSRSAPLQLVSHVTRNQQTRIAQDLLYRELGDAGCNCHLHRFFVSSRSAAPAENIQHDIENSQRTRSFLFLILGALVARRSGHRELLMLAENGQMAIHLALNPARVGPYSTYTAHPDVLALTQTILQASLQFPLTIQNPYWDLTKAEVVSRVVNDLPGALPSSTSCWRNTRLPENASHCGECIPCIVRRVAIEMHIKDATQYARDVWSVPIAQLGPDDEGRRNLVDYAEFVHRIRGDNPGQIMARWPELRSRNFDAARAIEMYKRAAAEACEIITRYPAVASLFQ